MASTERLGVFHTTTTTVSPPTFTTIEEREQTCDIMSVGESH